MVAASTAFSPSSTMTASLVESTGLPSAAIPVHEDGNNGNGDSSADGSGDDGGQDRPITSDPSLRVLPVDLLERIGT